MWKPCDFDDDAAIYDTLAPIQTWWIRHRPQAPWYDDNLRQAKRDKCRLERKFRKSGLTVDKQQFELKCSEYNSLLEKNKTGRPQSAFQTFWWPFLSKHHCATSLWFSWIAYWRLQCVLHWQNTRPTNGIDESLFRPSRRKTENTPLWISSVYAAIKWKHQERHIIPLKQERLPRSGPNACY